MLKTILIIVLLFASVAEAKNLYVNNSGSPACSDSTTYANNNASNPWCTIGRAAWGNATRPTSWPGSYQSQAATSGDVVYITTGTYHYSGVYTAPVRWEPLYRLVNARNATDYITFTTTGGDVTLTSNTAGSHGIAGGDHLDRYVKWTGGDNWFIVNQANMGFRGGAGIINTKANYSWYEKWDITGAYYVQVPGDQHVGILAQGPESTGCACTGGYNNLIIRNNKIHGFTGTSGRNDSAITTYCIGDNLLIEHNEIYGNQTGIYGKCANQQSLNVNIRFNNFYSNGGDAISMMAFDSWHVYQNIMRDNGGAAFHFFNGPFYQGSPKPTNTYVVNNTMDNNQYPIHIEGPCENMSNNYVRNNLITSNTRIIFTEGTACITTVNMGTDNVWFNNNLYEYSGTFWASEDSFSSTFANWRSTYGQDTASINIVDPLYVNEAAKNYRLQAGSPARNAGIDILDLNNNSITTDAINMGAYITGNETIGIATSVPFLRTIGVSTVP